MTGVTWFVYLSILTMWLLCNPETNCVGRISPEQYVFWNDETREQNKSFKNVCTFPCIECIYFDQVYDFKVKETISYFMKGYTQSLKNEKFL